MKRKFKIGDLVQNSHLQIGIITKIRSDKWHKHYWVHWNNGESCTIHERFLEIMSESR